MVVLDGVVVVLDEKRITFRTKMFAQIGSLLKTVPISCTSFHILIYVTLPIYGPYQCLKTDKNFF